MQPGVSWQRSQQAPTSGAVVDSTTSPSRLVLGSTTHCVGCEGGAVGGARQLAREAYTAA